MSSGWVSYMDFHHDDSLCDQVMQSSLGQISMSEIHYNNLLNHAPCWKLETFYVRGQIMAMTKFESINFVWGVCWSMTFASCSKWLYVELVRGLYSGGGVESCNHAYIFKSKYCAKLHEFSGISNTHKMWCAFYFQVPISIASFAQALIICAF